MSTVADITPPHEPISLARDMVELAPEAKAAAYVLVSDKGELWFDMCGHEQAYIAWALNKMLHKLMEDKD